MAFEQDKALDGVDLNQVDLAQDGQEKPAQIVGQRVRFDRMELVEELKAKFGTDTRPYNRR